MALIRCAGCGNMISDKAIKCPKCGCPVDNSTNLKQTLQAEEPRPQEPYYNEEEHSSNTWLYAVIGILTAALIIGLAAWLFLFNDDKRNQIEQIVSSTSMTDAETNEMNLNDNVTSGEITEQPDIQPQQERIIDNPTPQVEIRCELTGRISSIEGVKMVLYGNQGTLTYIMDGERINSNIEVDYNASNIDENGFGHLVLKSYTLNGRLKGRFIGEMNSAGSGYLYEGQFVNVNGGSTTFFLSE